ERIEGNDEIELLLEREMTRVGYLESKIGHRAEVRCSEVYHLVRRIDAHNRAFVGTLRDLGGDLPISAADIQDSRRAVQLEKSEDILSHRFLERRPPRILSGVPFCHCASTL